MIVTLTNSITLIMERTYRSLHYVYNGKYTKVEHYRILVKKEVSLSNLNRIFVFRRVKKTLVIISDSEIL